MGSGCGQTGVYPPGLLGINSMTPLCIPKLLAVAGEDSIALTIAAARISFFIGLLPMFEPLRRGAAAIGCFS